MRKLSAERCTDAQRELHVARQRNLGERMIGDHDRPRRIELVVSGVLFVAMVAVAAAHYFKWSPTLNLAGCFS